jgi:hypothetical protein
VFSRLSSSTIATTDTGHIASQNAPYAVLKISGAGSIPQAFFAILTVPVAPSTEVDTYADPPNHVSPRFRTIAITVNDY